MDSAKARDEVMRVFFILISFLSFCMSAEELNLSCDVVYTEKSTASSRTDVTGDVNVTIQETITANPESKLSKIKINLDLATFDGNIQYPIFMLPPINGSKSGVIKIKKINVSDDSYTLISNFNFMNRVITVIDRKTGDITGSTTLRDRSYTGTCEKEDPTVENKF